MLLLLKIVVRKFSIAALIVFLLTFATQFTPSVSAQQVNHLTSSTSTSSSCASPPATFNAQNASNTELQFYGLPLLGPGKDRTEWLNVLSHAKHRVCDSHVANVGHHSPPAPVSANSTHFTNWAGYLQSGNFVEVQGYWTVNFYSDNSPSDSDESSWIGLGGNCKCNLLQAGTYNGPVDGHNDMWWEEWPNPPHDVGSLICNSGDQFYGEVSYNYGDNNQKQDYAFVEDVPCGTYFGQVVDTGFVPAASAEWIDERPSCGSTNYYKLANFQTDNWSYGVTTNGSSATYLGGTQIDMFDYNGTLPLATTGSVNSSNHGFTDTWRGFGTSKCG